MAITTSYFAVGRRLEGTKISVTRFNFAFMRKSFDERQPSFAPSVDLLQSYKAGKIDWEQYSVRYLSEQRKHYQESQSDFEELLERAEKENLVLLCYERFEGPKTKCHRFLLIDILKKVAGRLGYDVEFYDEEYPRK